MKYKLGDKVRIINPEMTSDFVDDYGDTPHTGYSGIICETNEGGREVPYSVRLEGGEGIFYYNEKELELLGPKIGEQLLFGWYKDE